MMRSENQDAIIRLFLSAVYSSAVQSEGVGEEWGKWRVGVGCGAAGSVVVETEARRKDKLAAMLWVDERFRRLAVAVVIVAETRKPSSVLIAQRLAVLV